jgi:hypothetical protein
MRKSCPQIGHRTLEESFAGWHTSIGDLLSCLYFLQIQTVTKNEFNAGTVLLAVGIS